MVHFFASGGAAPPALIGGSTGYNRDGFRCHLSAVETLTQAGIAPPAQWEALKDRYAAYINMGNPSTDRLAAEVVQPTGADLATLRAVAVAEEQATGGADATVNERVQAAVLRQLEALYSAVAKRNYRTAADRYDTAAKRFTGAANTVNVESSGDMLISASGAQREAWLQAPSLAADLDAARHVLFAAATLAGASPDVAFVSAATDARTVEHQIALACDPGRAHRRKVWLAWATTDGRTGKWGALHALGVKLRAAGDPTKTVPYKQPEQPVAVSKPGGRLGYWDPHDGDLPRGWQPVNTGWIAEKPSTSGVL